MKINSVSALIFILIIPCLAAADSEYEGLIFPSEQIVLSVLSSGVVDLLPYKEGMRVKKGKTLLRMNMKKDSLNLQLAQRAYERGKIEKANEIEKKIQVDLKKVAIEEKRITAPFSGTIIKLMGKKHEYYNAGSQVIEFANLNRLKTEIHVTQKDLELLKKKGSKIKVVQGDKKIKGKMESFIPIAQPGIHRFLVKISFKNTYGWSPGTSVKVFF